MEYPALRRFYKITKGLLYSESDVRRPLFLCLPACWSGLLLAAEML